MKMLSYIENDKTFIENVKYQRLFFLELYQNNTKSSLSKTVLVYKFQLYLL